MSVFDLRRVTDAEQRTRLLLRSTVEAFRDYAIAQRAADPTKAAEPLTEAQQDLETTRTAVLVQTFYNWVRDDMVDVCCFGAGDVIN